MNSSLLLCCFHYVHVFCDYLESKRLHSSWIIDVCGVPQSVPSRGKSSSCSCLPFLLQLLPFFDFRCSFLFNFRTFLSVFVRSLLPLQPSYSLVQLFSMPCSPFDGLCPCPPSLQVCFQGRESIERPPISGTGSRSTLNQAK